MVVWRKERRYWSKEVAREGEKREARAAMSAMMMRGGFEEIVDGWITLTEEGGRGGWCLRFEYLCRVLVGKCVYNCIVKRIGSTLGLRREASAEETESLTQEMMTAGGGGGRREGGCERSRRVG